MKAALIIALMVATAAAWTRLDFQKWAAEHNKNYETENKASLRFKIWLHNMESNARFNAQGHSWTVGANKFTDLTPEEFESMYLMRPQVHGNVTTKSARGLVGETVDWTSDCTAVKDQGDCGSCWTFATTGSIETCRKITGDGELISLSEQQLVDCCTGACCNGCKGGTIQGGLKCAESGLTTETAYPYTEVDTKDCKEPSSLSTKITSLTAITSGSVSQLQSALKTQPIAVAIDARLLSPYTGGIWCPDACSTSTLDHAVLLVGIDTTAKEPYYKIKNSWGARWGEEGYFRMCIGDNHQPATAGPILPVARIVPSRDVRSQFHALCMLAHPRCGRGHGIGARSRALARRAAAAAASPSLALAIRVVWDWVLRDAPIAWLNVRMGKLCTCYSRRDDPEAAGVEALFTLGVSLATLGVVPGNTRHWARRVWHGPGHSEILGANCYHLVERIQGDAMVYLKSRDWGGCGGDECEGSGSGCGCGEVVGSRETRCSDRVPLTRYGFGGEMGMCMNRKWLVVNETSSVQESLVLVNLLSVAQQQNQNPKQTSKVIPIHGNRVSAVFMDEYNSDEALLIFVLEDCWDTVVINLEQLWSSVDCTFIPISSTRFRLQPGINFYQQSKFLILRTESLTRAFIGVGSEDWRSSVVIHCDESSPTEPGSQLNIKDPIHIGGYCGNMQVSQLSDRLYCVSAMLSCEIWDCNNPSGAIKVVQFPGCEVGLPVVFGHCGFMFHLLGDRVVVTDYASDTKVAVFTCTKGKVHSDHTYLSFLL
ncbi:cysteine proteinase [Pelomyxa schiedti]|nr:cysteine proteinase [Pelomyxa schiedti]